MSTTGNPIAATAAVFFAGQRVPGGSDVSKHRPFFEIDVTFAKFNPRNYKVLMRVSHETQDLNMLADG